MSTEDNRNSAQPVSVSLYPAQLRELDKIAEATGLTRSDLIQQAVNVVIAQFREQIDKTGNTPEKATLG